MWFCLFLIVPPPRFLHLATTRFFLYNTETISCKKSPTTRKWYHFVWIHRAFLVFQKTNIMLSFSITLHIFSAFLKYIFKFVWSMKGNKHLHEVLMLGRMYVHYFTLYCLLFSNCGGVCIHKMMRDWQIKMALGMIDIANLVLHTLCTFANFIVNKPHTGKPYLQSLAHCCHPCLE